MQNRARLIEAEVPYLRQYVRALIGQADQADDLVQACLEQALARPAEDWSRAALRLWLFRVQHETCLAWLASRDREHSNDSSDAVLLREDGTRDTNHWPSPIREALERLPAQQRAVILLIVLQGLSYEEASEILEVPVGTIRGQLARIREGLRQHSCTDPTTRRGGGNLDRKESNRS